MQSEFDKFILGRVGSRRAETPSDAPERDAKEPSAPEGEWDYRKNTLDPRGNQLPAGAQGWMPNGDPAWGGGVAGTLKKYAWVLQGKPYGGTTKGDNWSAMADLFHESNEQVSKSLAGKPKFYVSDEPLVDPSVLKELWGRFGAGLLGSDVQSNVITDQNLQEKYKTLDMEAKEILKLWRNTATKVGLRPDAPADVRARFEEITKEQGGIISSAGVLPFRVNGQQVSLFAPGLKATETAVTALGDVVQRAAVEYKKAASVSQFSREEAGQDFGGIEGAVEKSQELGILPENKSLNEWGARIDNLSRLVKPELMLWDTANLLMSDSEAKMKTVENGYSAGNMFYSQAIKPALLAEWERRTADGEDPALAALALQNPWHEALGETVFDPLNFVGIGTKSAAVAKVAGASEEAVRGTGLAREVSKILAEVGDAPLGEARAIELASRIEQKIPEVLEAAIKRLEPNYSDLRALSPSGMRIHETKVVGDFWLTSTAGIMRGGGSADDVADMLTYATRLTHPDRATHLEGLAGLLQMSDRFGLGVLPFGDDAIETGLLLRNLADPDVFRTLAIAKKNKVDNLLELLKVAKGDPAKAAEIFNELMPQAISRQFPSYAKLSEEAKSALSPLTRAGLAIEGGTLGKARDWINGMLGTFYFSRPGWAARNFTSNFMMMLADEGPIKPFFRDGKFWSGSAIDVDLAGWFPKQPSSVKGLSLAGTQVKNVVGKANDAIEAGFAKRIYWSRFRENMDKMLTPGVALPSVEQFRTAGLVDDQIRQLTHIVRYEAYGNLDVALAKFAEKHGPDGAMEAWKRWQGALTEREMNGLVQGEYHKAIDELVNNPNATPTEIRKTFDELRNDISAKSAAASKSPAPDPLGFEKAVEAGHLDSDDIQKLNTLLDRQSEARDSLSVALGRARTIAKDPKKFEVLEQTFSATRAKDVGRKAQQLTDTAWEITKRAKKATASELAILWGKSVLGNAPVPGRITAQRFLDTLWPATKDSVAELYNAHYGKQLDEIIPLVKGLKDKNVQALFKDAVSATEELQLFRSAMYSGNEIYYVRNGLDDFFKFAKKEGVDEATAQAVMYEKGPLFQNWLRSKGRKLAPPVPKGAPLSPAQQFRGQQPGFLGALNKVEDYMLGNYGLRAAEKSSSKLLKGVKTLLSSKDAQGLSYASRITEATAISDKVGQHWRDFALLPYGEKTNLDHVLAWPMPYEFWYVGGRQGGTYGAWMRRIAQDPQVIARYARLKETMADINKEANEWWRFNVKVPPHTLGLPIEHELSFNLEANLWPLYGITGTDFNDPVKRVNWWANSVDDMGKFGPSVWSPVNMAIAVILNSQGQQDAAARWAGRLAPQSADVKAVASLFGQNLEVDPLVQMFSGNGIGDFKAMDPYEINRVAVELSKMEMDGEFTHEQSLEIARNKGGPLWEQAMLRATQLRAGGQIASFFLGAGFKARTENDKVIDAFYSDYHKLMSLGDAGLISPDERRLRWDSLRQQYPFMDTLLLSRKSGPEGDRAYAYNVLARIPPGQSTELFDVLGIDPKTTDKFWNNGGDLSFMNDLEKQQFLTSMTNLGAMLAVPNYVTKQEWNVAKDAYAAMRRETVKQFGYGIDAKIQEFFALDGEARDAYSAAHPEVQDALGLQTASKVSNPLLMKYYGGFDTIESYEWSKMYRALEKKYGPSIVDDAAKYNQLRDMLMFAEAKAYAKEHPNIFQYFRDKSGMTPDVKKAILQAGAMLPNYQILTLTGNNPANPAQQGIADLAQPEEEASFSDYSQVLGPSMTYLLADHFQNDRDLPESVMTALKYQAKNLGYDDEYSLLDAVGLSYYREAQR
jgi:hypothetical protein